MTPLKITRDSFPALLIDEESVALVFRAEEVVSYPYGEDGRRMVVIPRSSYEAFLSEAHRC